MKLLVITGLSGAGKSQALRAAEDLGYFCVDNLPPALFPKFIDIAEEANMPQVALALDIRSGLYFSDLSVAIDTLDNIVDDVTVVYLEADEHVLIQRFKTLRRPHPLSNSIAKGIEKEVKEMVPIKARANYVIDTSKMTNYNLKIRLKSILKKEQGKLAVSIVSFGFKYGILEEADLVFDMRFLPNPYYIPELKEKNGLSDDVRRFISEKPLAKTFVNYVVDYIRKFSKAYVAEGKESLTIGIGCTGGFHRSVAVCEALRDALSSEEVSVIASHRDLGE